jgi:hypothetical protein
MSSSRRASSVAVACVLFTGCGAAVGGTSTSGPTIADAGPSTTYLDEAAGPNPGPPAEVLDADVVFFDRDGVGTAGLDTIEVITDAGALQVFATRYVDGSPALGRDAQDALADGMVLVGGTVSIGCDGAERALLVNTGSDVRAVGVRPRPDRDVTCVRAIRSTALLAVTPDVLAAARGAG